MLSWNLFFLQIIFFYYISQSLRNIIRIRFSLAEYTWYSLVNVIHTKTNLYHICVVVQENYTDKPLVWSFIAFQPRKSVQIFLNETMRKIRDDAFGYSCTVVVVFGILGNILVILSILRQKMNLLKNNYYFLVLHLAICDLASLIVHIFNIVDDFWLDEPFSDHCPMITCRHRKHRWCFWIYRARYDVDHFITSLSCCCASIKTSHQSTKIESRLWSGVPCWADCRMWDTFCQDAL